MEEKDIEFVAKLPKIELHLHLDGSLSPGKFWRATCVRSQNSKTQNVEELSLLLGAK